MFRLGQENDVFYFALVNGWKNTEQNENCWCKITIFFADHIKQPIILARSSF